LQQICRNMIDKKFMTIFEWILQVPFLWVLQLYNLFTFTFAFAHDHGLLLWCLLLATLEFKDCNLFQQRHSSYYKFNAHTSHAKKDDSILFFQLPNVNTCLLLSFGKIWSTKTISMKARWTGFQLVQAKNLRESG
jgi:hypothetical protein